MAEYDPQTPTPHELMRGIADLREIMLRMEGRMVTNEVFKMYQEANDREFRDIKRDISDNKSDQAQENIKLHAKIEAMQKDREKEVEERRKEKSSRVFQLALAAFGAALSLIVAIVLLNLENGMPTP